jgi:anti-sigma regulatory factor (Ser/Thr protein kinase)
MAGSDDMAGRITLPAELASIGAARRFVRGVLSQDVAVEDLDVVTLLTSEVVTNAVVHAGTPVELLVRRSEGCVQIEASDAAPELPAVPAAATPTGSGLGLNIVATLAQEWGVNLTANNKTVWFRCSRGSYDEGLWLLDRSNSAWHPPMLT